MLSCVLHRNTFSNIKHRTLLYILARCTCTALKPSNVCCAQCDRYLKALVDEFEVLACGFLVVDLYSNGPHVVRVHVQVNRSERLLLGRVRCVPLSASNFFCLHFSCQAKPCVCTCPRVGAV